MDIMHPERVLRRQSRRRRQTVHAVGGENALIGFKSTIEFPRKGSQPKFTLALMVLCIIPCD